MAKMDSMIRKASGECETHRVRARGVVKPWLRDMGCHVGGEESGIGLKSGLQAVNGHCVAMAVALDVVVFVGAGQNTVGASVWRLQRSAHGI